MVRVLSGPVPKKYPKTQNIWKYLNTQKYDKFYLKSDSKTWKMPKILSDYRNYIFENLKFYPKSKTIPENSNLKLKKISVIPKIYWNTYIYLIYTKFFEFLGTPLKSRVRIGSKTHKSFTIKSNGIKRLIWFLSKSGFFESVSDRVFGFR